MIVSLSKKNERKEGDGGKDKEGEGRTWIEDNAGKSGEKNRWITIISIHMLLSVSYRTHIN